jgi:predicted RNA-binding protein with RPS1 domain
MLLTGQIIEVTVQTVAVFGLFCRYEEQDVLALIPEISWIASFCSCQQFAKAGDRLIVKVIHVDASNGKVSASIKGLYPDPRAGGLLAPGTEHEARVVRFVEKADRCNDGPGYLLELVPGAYAMVCANGLVLETHQGCIVTVRESDFSKRSVRVGVR